MRVAPNGAIARRLCSAALVNVKLRVADANSGGDGDERETKLPT